MEQPSITAFFDEDWDSLSKLFSTEDATDFMYQLHGDNEMCDGSAGMFFQAAAPASFWPVGMENAVGENFMCYDHYHNNNAYFQNASQESSPSHGSDRDHDHDHDHSVAFMTNLANDHMINLFQSMNDSSESMDFSNLANDDMVNNEQYQTVVADASNVVMVNNTENEQPDTDLKRKFAKTEPEEESPKKKPRVSRNANKNKKVAQPKPRKNQKAVQTCKDDEQETNNAAALQNGVQQISSCSYTSEDDSNNGSQSQESIGGEDKEASALNLNGKARASRGSATDPQSLYARKRRERINERLRILQNLIPNGTKVDISTMLEEAVHYVKFLQLQIKLLSSDDMWMYAPIVYNGLDLGVYGRIFTNQ